MNLAIRDIRHRVGRFLLTGFGIGLLLMIVMGMTGIYVGIVEDATLLVDSVGADLWVVQKDTHGPFAELSNVPLLLERRLEAVPGVGRSRAFLAHTIQRDHHGRSLRMALRGLAWPSDNGAWLPLASGRPIRQPSNEMVADLSLGLELDDEIEMGRETYRIVGLTHGMVGEGGDGLVFVTVSDALSIRTNLTPEAERLARAVSREDADELEAARTHPGLVEAAVEPDGPATVFSAGAAEAVSAIMVNVRDGWSVEAVKQAITRWPDVTVYTSDEQRALLLTGSVDKARRQIGLFRALLVVISGIIMGLIIYTMTMDKVHDIAMLKLMGARNGLIIGLILQQALLLGALGFVVAYNVGRPAFQHFPRRVIIHTEDLVALAVVVTGISIVSALIGILKASRVSPGEVL